MAASKSAEQAQIITAALTNAQKLAVELRQALDEAQSGIEKDGLEDHSETVANLLGTISLMQPVIISELYRWSSHLAHRARR